MPHPEVVPIYMMFLIQFTDRFEQGVAACVGVLKGVDEEEEGEAHNCYG